MLDLLAPGAGDAAWHGACLALAELARRGALLPARLPAAAPLVATALHFDARRGAHRRARRPQVALLSLQAMAPSMGPRLSVLLFMCII